MTSVDENKPRGLAPPCLQRVLKTAWFHILVLLLVLANAVTTATMHFDHNKIDPFDKIDNYYYVEVSIEITAIIRILSPVNGVSSMALTSNIFVSDW